MHAPSMWRTVPTPHGRPSDRERCSAGLAATTTGWSAMRARSRTWTLQSPSISVDRWCVSGIVVHGEQRGRAIEYPTANMELPRHVALPADGIYAGLVRGPEGTGLLRAAAISVGTNPTFDGQQRTLEAHLLDFDGDLYGFRLDVESLRRLRGMLRFTGVPDLVAAIARDVAETRDLVSRSHPMALASAPGNRAE
jgi:hypothetical protein